MAHTGEWQPGRYPHRPGSAASTSWLSSRSWKLSATRTDAEPGVRTGQHGNSQVQSARNAAGDAITLPSNAVPAWNPAPLPA